MKGILKRRFIRPAGRYARFVSVRGGLVASLAAMCILAGACQKEPEPEEDDRTHVEAVDDGWGSGGETGVYPDRGDRIRVNAGLSSLPSGAEVSGDGFSLHLSHHAADFVLAVESDEALELVPSGGGYLFSAGPAGIQEGLPLGGNEGAASGVISYFRITKGLYAPGAAPGTVTLQFRRKGLANVYPEDCIRVELAANPVKVSGPMDFDNTSYSHDFGRYVDNELGIFSLPEDKMISVEFAPGEDEWIRLEQQPDQPRTWRVLGGWRPNDPTADGRRQEAVVVITGTDGGAEREEYRVARRNYGLPVTWLHGVWWCKYNSMGDSRDFDDQILSSEDPAAAAGISVFDYLGSISSDEYRSLWQWAYNGDSGQGMTVTEKDGVPVMDGYNPGQVNINRLPADALSPDGYELPSMEDFNRIFDGTGTVWMAWNGSYEIREPWNGHSVIDRRQARKDGVQIGSLTLSDLLYVALSSPDYPEHEPLVWYGPGAQWNELGIEHSGHCNNILFSVHSPSGEGWYIGGNMGNLFVYKNGAGTKDTRILRFRKSDVEYIY